MNNGKKIAFGLLGISGFLFSIAGYLNSGLIGLLIVAGISILITSFVCLGMGSGKP